MDDEVWIEIERIRDELDRRWNEWDDELTDVMDLLKAQKEDSLIKMQDTF